MYKSNCRARATHADGAFKSVVVIRDSSIKIKVQRNKKKTGQLVRNFKKRVLKVLVDQRVIHSPLPSESS
jgi:hypothetical protein